MQTADKNREPSTPRDANYLGRQIKENGFPSEGFATRLAKGTERLGGCRGSGEGRGGGLQCHSSGSAGGCVGSTGRRAWGCSAAGWGHGGLWHEMDYEGILGVMEGIAGTGLPGAAAGSRGRRRRRTWCSSRLCFPLCAISVPGAAFQLQQETIKSVLFLVQEKRC